jgi:RecA-family ATPase
MGRAGIICEGVSLLAGPPKVGKSWLSLALGIAVASGGTAFGRIPVRQGPVLYLALEDTLRRLQARTGKLLGDTPAPAGLAFVTEYPVDSAEAKSQATDNRSLSSTTPQPYQSRYWRSSIVPAGHSQGSYVAHSSA